MLIGSFQTVKSGFRGHVATLTLDAMIAIVPAAPSDAENAPAWRILLGDADSGIEVGAGWDRSGERAGAYIALQLDDPALPAPLRANLIRSAQDESEYHLLWSRPQARERA